ncbi:FKBP-type peptidyl-prolyl cis-trans isomerase [Gimesia benthica]|uniref:Peptidyl-prolyl cis-trans isomerase n=1 Tax=Gimesia benthica TaxID=2608982 RepID=A0A6I6AEK6_9PLAN|nr:FKBP-type peptidyl-prolyl cis-trans isomerase [Gimesia benthica]QGQ25034.1 FKBP-type peptidyl-prolyl cis-trans isomerase [Gimesia benthica]
MKKTRFLLGCSLICLTATGCSNYVRQGEQVDPPAASAQVSPADNQQTEMEVAVADEANPGYSTTASGLKYRIVREGNDTKPGPQDQVTVHYRGTLEDGTEFDSSYKRGETISFPLNGVIPGWTEGLQLIGEGGEVELVIPPELGYGAAGAPPVIPGNATLHFKVELFKVN